MNLTVYDPENTKSAIAELPRLRYSDSANVWRLDFINGAGIRHVLSIEEAENKKGAAALDAINALSMNGIDVSHVHIRWI
ncbi:hypothetical protein [Streptomyces sp. NPDC055085]